LEPTGIALPIIERVLMENTARSQRTREAAIEAALTIITRDGPSRLTIDAIARESGISKGGVLHQFRTKEAVLKALLEYQIEKGEAVFNDNLSQLAPAKKEPVLEAQIATLRTAAAHPTSTSLAIAGALGESPDLLAAIRVSEGKRAASIRQQAADPRLALVRWSAARGLALAAILDLCPLSEEERLSLFDYLQDDENWGAEMGPIGRPKGGKAHSKKTDRKK
jgi:AcrR family transcriptional regulator